jgi:hypothetical protein
MTSYPDANYAPMPSYPSSIGDSCAKPCPYTFYDGGTFCSDVDINTNLSVAGSVAAGSLIVGGVSYKKTLFLNSFDGLYYYVLANKLPADFIPPDTSD